MASSDKNKASAKEKRKLQSPESRKDDKAMTKEEMAAPDVIDGRIFAVDEKVEMSEEEKSEAREFEALMRRHYALAKEQRMDSLMLEEKELKGEKSPMPTYYEGTRSDRINQIENEVQIMREMDQMARQKIK